MNSKVIWTIVIIVLALAVLVWAFSDEISAPGALNTTEEITLDPGETDEAFDLNVTFNRIVSDNRCPVDVLCVQAGQFTGEFIFRPEESTTSITRQLSYSGATSTETVVNGYRVAITDLKPETLLVDEPPAPDDYEVTLIVRRQSATSTNQTDANGLFY